jgi:hypothetical protein
MMRVLPVGILVLLGVAPIALAAQDTATVDPPRRAAQLRQMIDQRFGQRLKQDLGLSDEQAARMRGVQASVAERRRVLQTQEQQLRAALAYQLRPGIAANPDSVAKLVSALTAQRVALAQTFQDEMRELTGLLTPVQRGQYLILRDRLMMQVEELRREMQAPRSVPRPGRRPPPRG